MVPGAVVSKLKHASELPGRVLKCRFSSNKDVWSCGLESVFKESRDWGPVAALGEVRFA